MTATGYRSDVYEIGFEDETFMRCTGDHKVMVRLSTGETSYKEAKTLVAGDDVVSLN
ncbi:hedgehog/intein (Hint) domain protein [Listeria phage LIS04]|nr:hedgehog/intein (Hint) domain protein [Listeria phage LIS04]